MARIQAPSPTSGGSSSTLTKASVSDVNTGTDDTKYLTPLARAGSDGWQAVNETWAYATASTITIPSGGATKYAVGDRLKFTQHSVVKYAVVVTVADTLLTILVNTDYVVENTGTYPITLNYYSHELSPIGYPHWFTCVAVTWDTGSIDNGAGGQPTTSEHRANIIGRNYKAHMRVSGTKVGATYYFDWTSPVAIVNYNYRCCVGFAHISVDGADYPCEIMALGPTTFYLLATTTMADNKVLNDVGINVDFEI